MTNTKENNIKEEIMDFENNQEGVSLPHFLQRGKAKVVSFQTVWTVLEVGTFKKSKDLSLTDIKTRGAC